MAYTKHRRLGLWLIYAPSVTLLLVLSGFALFQLLLPAIPGALATSKIVLFLLGLLSIISIIGSAIATPIGFYLAGKREIPSGATQDERSGKGSTSILPDELRGWSWGAFTFDIWWGLYFHVWHILLYFIPFINIIAIFYIAIQGHKLAWAAQPWESVDEFKKVMGKANRWGLILFIAKIVLVILSVMVGLFIPSIVKPTQTTTPSPTPVAVITQTDAASQPVATETVIPDTTTTAATTPSAESPLNTPGATKNAWLLKNAAAAQLWQEMIAEQPLAPNEKHDHSANTFPLEVSSANYTYQPERADEKYKGKNFVLTSYPLEGIYAYENATGKNTLIWVPQDGVTVKNITQVPIRIKDSENKFFITFQYQKNGFAMERSILLDPQTGIALCGNTSLESLR